MKLKSLITILVLAALFSGVVLWRVDRFVYGDRMQWAEAQARSQVSSISQAINVEIQSARRMLGTVTNESFKRETANWKAFQPYYALALMTSQGGSLAITRMVSKADSPAASWTANELGQYIGFMGKELESKGTVLLRSFKGPNKEGHVAVIFAGGGNAYILVGKGENFQALIESQKGSMSSFSIIASDGLMISHAMPEYIGSVMSDSTLLKEIRATNSAHGLGSYQQGKQQIFGMYEMVPGTNAYVISTVPMEDLLKGRLSLAWQFVFMLVGLGFIGAAIYFWQEKRAGEMTPLEAPQPAVVISSPKPASSASYSPEMTPPPKSPKDIPTAPMPAPIVTSNETLVAPIAPKEIKLPPAQQANVVAVTPQELQAEKAEAYRQVAAALGNEMRTPLASILGFSQMVLSKTQEPEVVQAVESILREARSSRDVLEKLVTFTGERSSEKAESKIEGPIMQALKNIDSKIQQKGIRVEKDFKETSPWSMAATDITKAFENIFVNSIEAMERMQDKIIKISTWEEADGLHVSISDTGEGIEMENVSKVFDPFFTTRSFAHHVGLGLPVVVGILKEHQAQVKIQSQRGKGTTVDIVFAQAAMARVPAGVALPKPPPPMKPAELPGDLPRVSMPSKEDVAAHEEARKEAAKPKLTEMNVDSLLEMPEDDMPLQFLDGQGFDDMAPSAPLPRAAAIRPTKPAVAPPVRAKSEDIMPAPPMAPPPPAVPASIPSTPPSFVAKEDDIEEIETPKAEPTVVIDKPSSAPTAAKSSGLDSYKVEVRRPGKRN
jgi:two-component system NtrC family sensor kinase